ncbi:MAG TPA: hypothetical protein DEQ34_01790 [Balneolaceae bacterium]|nr:hypothetical protein [Balneolaceae bacterium]|tara:strand:- start:80079 stop:80447 length:369 start_codon:yes stop_codon:yes gene_type:complete
MSKKYWVAQILPVTALLITFFFASDRLIAIGAGYLISTLFVFAAVFVVERFWNVNDEQFLQIYFFAMAIRFLIVLISFAVLVFLLKFDEIYFTVSFIISYLYQSVIEIILFQKSLHNRSKYR